MIDQVKAYRDAVKRNLINFAERVDPKYHAEGFHEYVAMKLQECYEKVKRGEKARLIIEMPPRHGKSELATIKFPAWVLGNSPDWPIMVSSYNADLATKFGQKTRDIMNDERYAPIFETRLRTDSRAKGSWLTSEGGGYLAAGIGGGITGRGFKIGIIDDPIKDRQEADSKNVRDSIWDWYTSTFYPRQEGNGAIIVICTRWHLDDLVGRLEQMESEQTAMHMENIDQWEYVTFPAIAEKDEEYCIWNNPEMNHGRKVGEALWPEKFSIENLQNIKNSIGVYDFASLYQQHPITQEHQVFKREMFKHYYPNELRGLNLDAYTLVDPAISDAEGADNWVVLTIGKEKSSPNIYRLEESVGKGNPDKMLGAIFYHQEKFHSRVYVETAAFQKILKRDIREMQRQKSQYFVVREIRHGKMKNKIGRIQALQPLYSAGVIYHSMQDKEYEDELMEFPFGRHDDRIDAMSFLSEALSDQPTDYMPQMQIPRKKINIDPFW